LVDDDANRLIDRMLSYKAPDIYKWISEEEV